MRNSFSWIKALLWAGILTIASTPASAQGGRVHRLLPAHFMLGLANGSSELEWLRNARVPIEMRYQYLSGGVNTGQGWTTWRPKVRYAADYVRDSRAVGAIPVFTYYNMLHSRPARGSSESEKVYRNLNNPETMRAYYEDFKLLMQRASAAGDRAVVHVEPDLFGYLQRDYADGGRRSAREVSAAVASTGMQELRGLPNTGQGFGRALLRLRNRYGRGVLLAIHASDWASGTDIGSSQNPRVDARGIGVRTGRFLRGFGEGWNLVFVSPSDRDAGWMDRYRPGGTHWWDPANRAFPNFERYRQWVDGVSTGADLRVVLWQVPIGNRRYRTMNNTEGHFQDNRAEYFLESRNHIADYVRAGAIAILFGAGAAGTTHYDDRQRDGITNPPPINGNTLISRYTDDDGGYLRLAITRYYRVGSVVVPR